MEDNIHALEYASMPLDEFVAKASSRIFGFGVESQDRACVLFEWMGKAVFNDELLWTVFHLGWPSCDGVDGELLDEMGTMLMSAPSCGTEYLQGNAKAFYESLPDEVEIYRGCSPDRRKGWSWTTQESVARGFASGHRLIDVRNGTVYRAIVRKNEILTVFADREEFEIFIHPSSARKLRVHERLKASERLSGFLKAHMKR